MVWSALYGIGPVRSSAGGKAARSGASAVSPSATAPAQAKPTAARPALQRVGERRPGGRGEQRDERRQLLRRAVHQRPAAAQRLARLRPRVDEHPAVDHRADPPAAERELRDDAEVPTAAAQRPEQVGVLLRARPHDAAVGKDDLGGDERVDREAVRAHQPADAAAEREPADAGVGDVPGRDREPVLLGRAVDLAEQRAAADAHERGRRVDATAFSPRRSMHSAPSRIERPEIECPPARTVNARPAARAARIAAATSSASVAWATAAGWRSITPLKTLRASS